MKLPIQPLTAAAFAPFGAVVEQPARAADAGGPGWHWWGENHTLAGGDRPYAIGYLDLQPAPLAFDWAERHMLSDELIIPAGGDCLVYVAPRLYPDEPGRLPPFDLFQVFQVRSGQGALVAPGVWHGAPLALDTPSKAIVLLLRDTGRVDLHLVRFPETPVQIERS